MGYQEAIESHINECIRRIDIIRNHMNANGDADKDVCNKNIDVLKITISAMQELKMYKDGKLCLIPEDVYGKQCEELDRYKELGTLEEVREAVEKQKRKKPCASNRCYVCPRCGLVTSLKIKHNYCDACGQRIDWSVEE
ncbi:MAG: hypothetical protein MR332_13290 [Fusicatenibacter sp.]|nr:hypothetical protein [Fusicatenibacter sp.]